MTLYIVDVIVRLGSTQVTITLDVKKNQYSFYKHYLSSVVGEIQP